MGIEGIVKEYFLGRRIREDLERQREFYEHFNSVYESTFMTRDRASKLDQDIFITFGMHTMNLVDCLAVSLAAMNNDLSYLNAAVYAELARVSSILCSKVCIELNRMAIKRMDDPKNIRAEHFPEDD